MMLKSALATVLFSLLLVACGEPPTLPVAVAPFPHDYTCDELRRAAIELRSLPDDAVVRRLLGDYAQERAELRALHKLPAGCVKEAEDAK